ncbi:MAG: hypothetical protein WCJ95_22940, partial [Mariniphaga sp.]
VISWYHGMSVTASGWNSATPSGFQIATSGDQVFAYQGTWGTNQTLLYGVQVGNSDWLTSGTASSNTSYLPSALTNNVTATTFSEINGCYNLITTGTTSALESLIAYPANWNKSSAQVPTPAWNFVISTATLIYQDAKVQNMLVKPGETCTIQPGIKFTVLGDLNINGGN